jgi:hypothetical protein
MPQLCQGSLVLENVGGLRVARVLASVVVAVVAVALPSTTAAGSRGERSEALSLDPSFHRAGSVGAGLVLTDGRYVYLPITSGDGGSGTLVDERTGKRRGIAEPGCAPSEIGGGWVLFECSPSTRRLGLYAIATGKWHTISWRGVGYPQAVGSDWIDFLNDPGCPDSGPCDSQSRHEFQNIHTGKVVSDYRPVGNRIPDLNSPTLYHRLCAPLHTTTSVLGDGATVFNPLTLAGRFVLSTQSAPGGGGVTDLEKCGTRRRWLLSTTSTTGWTIAPAVVTATNPDVVIWPTGTFQLAGIFLPSLTRFAIAVPTRIGPVETTVGARDSVVLTRRTLYLLNGRKLWSTPAPTATSSHGAGSR